MSRPVRAILCAALGAACASLCLFAENHHVVPPWTWGIWILFATCVGFWVGARGFSINRDKFGVMFIVLASLFFFMLGSIRGQVFDARTLRVDLIYGAIFLVGLTLMIRIMIRLMRWAERKWS